MASDVTWTKVKKYFKKDSKIDKWGDPDLISDDLLLRLYDFRDWLGLPIYILHGVKTGGHSASSFHYPRKDKDGKQIGACAVDIVIPDYDESPFDLILTATRFGFTGIGYYPHWKYKGITTGGLHVDTRPLKWDKDDTLNYSHSRWLGVKIAGKQQYIEMDFQNLLNYTEEYAESGDEKLH